MSNVNDIISQINSLTGFNIPSSSVNVTSGSSIPAPYTTAASYTATTAPSGTISTAGITPGSIITAEQILRIINALNGTSTDTIIISGSLLTSGSTVIDSSLVLPFIQDGNYLFVTGGFVTGSTGIVSSSFASSASYAATSSLTLLGIVTASATATTITFTKGDETTFDVTIAQSGSVESASYATFAQNAGAALTAISASYALMANYAKNAETASYVLQAVSSSYALTASFALNVPTQSVSSSFAVSASRATSAANADTASFVTTAQTASYVNLAQTASYVLNAISASRATSAANSDTASFVTLAQTASYVLNAVSASRAISAVNADTASFVTLAQTASYVANAVSASRATSALTADTASYVINATSSSFAISASYALTSSRAITASVAILAEFATSAGNTPSASRATSAANADNATSSSYALSASYTVSASYATLATTANTASYVVTAQTASYVLNAVSSSRAVSAETASLPLLGIITASANASTITFTRGDQTTFDVTIAQSGSVQSSSYAAFAENSATASLPLLGIITASANASTITFTRGDQTTFNVSISQTGSVQSASYATFAENAGAALTAVSSSYALTASYALNVPTQSVSSSYAASASVAVSASYATTASIANIQYVTNSGNLSLGQIQVLDYSDSVATTYVNGLLTFVFGTPAAPSALAASIAGFVTDRFNQVTDNYTVNTSWSNGGYSLISASIYEGSTFLTGVTDSGTSLSYNTTTSGSHTYKLAYTASNPLDSSIYTTSTTTTGTISKTAPGSPTISATPTIQLGFASSQFEQGATGSIAFTSASGATNGWVSVYTTSSVASPYTITGSLTGSTSVSIVATSYYSSSGVSGSDNSPALINTSATTTTYSKIRSLRSGATLTASYSQAQLEDLGAWDTTLGGSVGTIQKGTTTATGQTVVINWTGSLYQYIVYDSSRPALTAINSSGFNVIGSFTLTTTGSYKVYKTTDLQAGYGGTTATYTLI